MTRTDLDEIPARIFLRPIGAPLPLGLLGLVVASGVLSSFNLGWVPTNEQHQIAYALMAFAFPLQALSAILLFLSRDAPAGAAIGVLSVTWLTLGLLLEFSPTGSRSATVAVLLFAAAAALVPSAVTESLSKLVPAAVTLLASARLVLTGLYEKLGGSALEHAAGWEGVALGALALYVAFASELEGSLQRTVLPLGRHGTVPEGERR